MTRLPLLAPDALTTEQRHLYDDIVGVVQQHFGELITRRQDGALLGPFNGWLHFPQFGRHAWDFNKALWENRVLPEGVHQLVILVTAAKYGARYQIYGHEYFAERAGMSRETIGAVLAGQRPGDLAPDERVAYDLAATLNRGASVPRTTYQAALAVLGQHGVTEVVFLVGCFSMVAITLNAFDDADPV